MLLNLSREYNLRGYMLEYVARIILRRTTKNHFIFLTNRFDSFTEIVQKYKFDTRQISEIANYLSKHKLQSDIIEFVLNNKEERIITGIKFYDVKSKYYTVERNYFEMCISNHEFFTKMQRRFNVQSYIISIILFENWRISFNIFDFPKANIRKYTHFKEK